MEEDKKMLDILIILLVLFAIILMLYGLSERNTAWCFIDAVIWLSVSMFMIQGIEIPYQMYNNSANKIQVGVQTITSNLIPLSYLFLGISVLMFILFFMFIIEQSLEEKKNKYNR